MFTGRYYSSRPPLLLPPLHWREKLIASPLAATGGDPAVDEIDPLDAAPVVVAEEVITAAPARSTPRNVGRVTDQRREVATPHSVRAAPRAPIVETRDERSAIVRADVSPVGNQPATRELTRETVEPVRPISPPSVPSPVRERSEPFSPTAAEAPVAPSAAEASVAPSVAEPVRAKALENTESTPRSTLAPIIPAHDEPSIHVVVPPSSDETHVGDVRVAKTASEPPSAAEAPVERELKDVVAPPPLPLPPPGPIFTQEPTASTQPAGETTVVPRSAELAARAAAPSLLPPKSIETPAQAVRSDATTPVRPSVTLPNAIELTTEPTRLAHQASEEAQPLPLPRIAADESTREAAPVASALEAQPVTKPSVAETAALARVDDSVIRKVEQTGAVTHEPARRLFRDEPRREAPDEQTTSDVRAAEPTPDRDTRIAPPVRAETQPLTAATPPADIVEEEAPAIADRPAPPAPEPTGLRPTEERRSRRARPPVPSDPPERRSAKAPEISKQPAEESPPNEPPAPVEERSMFDWRRLLFEATSDPHPRPAAPAAPAVPGKAKEKPAPAKSPIAQPVARSAAQQPTPTPAAVVEPRIETEPLLESTRRFLRPLVGIDPATVPVVRGPIADRLVRDAGADAAAVADAVVLPSEHDERSPRTLALIAHELTHVAQRRQPRFVPPVVRASSAPGRSVEGSESPYLPLRSSSEEYLARRVERSVWNEAQLSAPQERGFNAGDRDDGTAQLSAARPPFEPRAERDSTEWGELPAPWEPLPVMSAPAAEPVTASFAAPAIVGEKTIHYAEHGRSFEGEATKSPHAAPADAAPPPDLDVLARKVYDVLKRRLAAERRREG
jgi:hypothetical protein